MYGPPRRFFCRLLELWLLEREEKIRSIFETCLNFFFFFLCARGRMLQISKEIGKLGRSEKLKLEEVWNIADGFIIEDEDWSWVESNSYSSTPSGGVEVPLSSAKRSTTWRIPRIYCAYFSYRTVRNDLSNFRSVYNHFFFFFTALKITWKAKELWWGN